MLPFSFALLIALTWNFHAQVNGPRVTHAEFGKLPGGQTVDQFTLTNANGMEVKALSFGCIITSIRVPDRNGKFDDVVLGYDNMDGYARNPSHFGAVIGRYANRIAGAQFTLDGKDYPLAANNRPNHIHGGVNGFDKKVWEAKEVRSANGVGVAFSYKSADGEEGYPGNLSATVTYTLTDANELIVEYQATTNKATPINLTQHSYFNLAGAGARDVLDHELTLNADGFTPSDAALIPTGVIAPVEGTPFDFRKPTKIGARINDSNEQLRLGNGYDHNFVINRQGPGLVQAARVFEPTSGRVLTLSTSEPGVQLYTANTLNATGKGGLVYGLRGAFCLETQHFPDSPNKPQFPSTILRPGQQFSSKTVFAFSVRPL